MTTTSHTPASYTADDYLRMATTRELDALKAHNAALLAALRGAVEALEYAQAHGLNTPSINGHKVLAERLVDARAALAAATVRT